MAIQRTRKQKAQAELHRALQPDVQYSFTAAGAKKTKSTETTTTPEVAETSNRYSIWFGYETRLIVQDIVKTLVVTAIMLAVLIGLRWWYY